VGGDVTAGRRGRARPVLGPLLCALAWLPACAAGGAWGGQHLQGPVVDGVYTHPSGVFSVWAPFSDTTDVRGEREWEWLFHEEVDDGQGFVGVVFGPALLDVSVFAVSVRPVVPERPTARDAFDALCLKHNALYRGGTARLHEALLDLDGVATGFRVYAYRGHARWEDADEPDVRGHVAYYHQRRAGHDVFFMLDVPATLEASRVPIAPGTLIDEAWDKQRRFVRSFRLHLLE